MDSDKKISLQMDIDFIDEFQAKIVYTAIQPEINFSPNERAQIKIQLSNNIIRLNINSSDFIILRAIINSYIKWFDISSKLIHILLE